MPVHLANVDDMLDNNCQLARRILKQEDIVWVFRIAEEKFITWLISLNYVLNYLSTYSFTTFQLKSLVAGRWVMDLLVLS